ncbi:MAG: carbohydrate kinase family protein [Acetobacteraceae bacterium]
MATVVSLGVQSVDVLCRPVRRIPDGRNVDLIDEIQISVAGAGIGLAKLGAQVAAMGAIGNDRLGAFLVQTMDGYGIDTSCLRRKDGVQTSATILPVRLNGDRPALHVRGANNALGWDDIDLDVIAGAKFLHLGGTYLMENFDGEPSRRALEFAKSHDITTTLDLIALERPDLLAIIEPCLPYVDYFMPGLDEARMISGLYDRGDVIRFFLDRGVGHTVFKMGAEGSSVAGHDGEVRVPAFEVPVVDSTGCGDAYCAGFIVGLSLGWDLQEAARLGSAAAGLVITGLGSDAGIVDLEQAIGFMRTAKVRPFATALV